MTLLTLVPAWIFPFLAAVPSLFPQIRKSSFHNLFSMLSPRFQSPCRRLACTSFFLVALTAGVCCQRGDTVKPTLISVSCPQWRPIYAVWYDMRKTRLIYSLRFPFHALWFVIRLTSACTSEMCTGCCRLYDHYVTSINFSSGMTKRSLKIFVKNGSWSRKMGEKKVRESMDCNERLREVFRSAVVVLPDIYYRVWAGRVDTMQFRQL